MRQEGQIKWFSVEKGYGFIANPGGTDIFLHHSEFLQNEDSLHCQEGDMVEFELDDGPKGPRATNIRLMNCIEQAREKVIIMAVAQTEEGSLEFFRGDDREEVAEHLEEIADESGLERAFIGDEDAALDRLTEMARELDQEE